MKRYISGGLVLVCIGLSACQSMPQQEAAPDTPPAARQQAATTETRPGRPDQDKLVEQLQPMLERLSGQQLKQQEQLLNVSSQYAQLSTTLDRAVMLLKKQSQLIMQRPQAQEGNGSQAQAPAEFEQMMDQVIALLNDQGAVGGVSAGSQYGVSSAYTAKGQWVLIRYDRRSGETWLADQGRWQPLQDAGPALAAGDYRVLVLRADQDVKGYVASRIEQRTGVTWWLRQNRWQKFSAQ